MASFRTGRRNMPGNGRILLANSSEQNLCEKICSYRGAKLDENRTSTPTNSTIMQSIGAVCRLVVISPAVSGKVRDIEYTASLQRSGRVADSTVGGRGCEHGLLDQAG